MLLKVPLLLGLIALGPPVCSAKFVDESKNTQLFAIGVEFAVFQFNQAQEDEYAYKLLWVGRSQRKVSGASTPPPFPSPSPLPARLHVGPETDLGGVNPWSAKEEREIFCFGKYFFKMQGIITSASSFCFGSLTSEAPGNQSRGGKEST